MNLLKFNFDYKLTIGEMIITLLIPIIRVIAVYFIIIRKLKRKQKSPPLFINIFFNFVVIFFTFSCIKWLNNFLGTKGNGCVDGKSSSEWKNIIYQTLLIQVGIETMLFFINMAIKNRIKDPYSKFNILSFLWIIIFYGMYYITMTINNNQKDTYCNDNMYKCVNLGNGIIPIMSTISIFILGFLISSNGSNFKADVPSNIRTTILK